VQGFLYHKLTINKNTKYSSSLLNTRRPCVKWRTTFSKFSYQKEQWTGKAVWRNCVHFSLYNVVPLSIIWSHPTRFREVISVDLRSSQPIRKLAKLKYGRQLTVTASTRHAWSRVIKQLAEICSDEVENKVSLKFRLVRGIR
jgi:hypothetical protein